MTNLDVYNAAFACRELAKCKGLPILALIALNKNAKLGNAITEEVKEIRQVGDLHKHGEDATKQAESDFLRADYNGKEFIKLSVDDIQSAVSEGIATSESVGFLAEKGILLGLNE